MKVFVTGASGFVGRNLLPELLKKNHTVSSWTRKENGDITDPTSDSKLREALKSCDAVVHLAAKTSEGTTTHTQTGSVNVEGTSKILNFSKEAGVKRFIFVSSQSAKITNPGPYGASKKAGEKIVQTSGMDAVILRPAIIYGGGEAGIFKKFVSIVEKVPIIPIPYTSVTFQPVFIKSVVDSILSSLETSSILSKEYDVVGPDPVSFPGLIKEVAKAKGLSRILIPIPMPLAILGAKILSAVMKKPPVTVDNLLGLSEKTPVNIKPMTDELKVSPVPLQEGLKLCLN